MADLLRKPNGTSGKVHDITPESAGWGYVGFGLYRLQPGETAAEVTGDREVILVLVEGKAQIHAAGQDWGILGDRMDVFEKTPPHCLYVPNDSDWHGHRDHRLHPGRSAPPPAKSGHKAAQIGPAGITPDPARRRRKHPLYQQHRDGSVWTWPTACWSPKYLPRKATGRPIPATAMTKTISPA